MSLESFLSKLFFQKKMIELRLVKSIKVQGVYTNQWKHDLASSIAFKNTLCVLLVSDGLCEVSLTISELENVLRVQAAKTFLA